MPPEENKEAGLEEAAGEAKLPNEPNEIENDGDNEGEEVKDAGL